MSRVRDRFLKDWVTRWRESGYDEADPYAAGWSTPVNIKCNYASGGQIQRDQEGAEFQPATTYRIKSTDVQNGDRVSLGKLTDATPPSGSETVRKVATKTTLIGTPDMTVYTG